MTSALGAFCLAASLEFLWSKMMAARDRGDILHTVGWNLLLDFTATAGVWLVVDERWLVVPGLAGGALGLALGMWKTRQGSAAGS